MKMFKAVAALLLASAFAAAHADTPPPAEPMQPSRVSELLMSDNDKVFMNKAASAGLYEVQASQLALQKSSDPDIKTFAQHMVDDHTKAGSELTALAAKKNVAVPTAPVKSDQSMLDTLQKKPAGTKFDAAYRKQMVESHKKAVSLFDNEARNGKDADVKAWAAQTLPTLQQHGGMAKDLKKAS